MWQNEEISLKCWVLGNLGTLVWEDMQVMGLLFEHNMIKNFTYK